MFYATLLLLEISRAGLPTPGFREYHRDLVTDKIDRLTAEAKAQYGMLHLREALHNMRSARFEGAIAHVGSLHTNA